MIKLEEKTAKKITNVDPDNKLNNDEPLVESIEENENEEEYKKKLKGGSAGLIIAIVIITIVMGFFAFITWSVIDIRSSEINNISDMISKSQQGNRSLHMLVKFNSILEKLENPQRVETIQDITKELITNYSIPIESIESEEKETKQRFMEPFTRTIIAFIDSLLGIQNTASGKGFTDSIILRKAYIEERNSNFKESINLFNQFLEENPNVDNNLKADIYLHIGYINALQNVFNEAYKYFNLVIELANPDSDTYYVASEIKSILERIEERREANEKDKQKIIEFINNNGELAIGEDGKGIGLDFLLTQFNTLLLYRDFDTIKNLAQKFIANNENKIPGSKLDNQWRIAVSALYYYWGRAIEESEGSEANLEIARKFNNTIKTGEDPDINKNMVREALAKLNVLKELDKDVADELRGEEKFEELQEKNEDISNITQIIKMSEEAKKKTNTEEENDPFANYNYNYTNNTNTNESSGFGSIINEMEINISGNNTNIDTTEPEEDIEPEENIIDENNDDTAVENNENIETDTEDNETEENIPQDINPVGDEDTNNDEPEIDPEEQAKKEREEKEKAIKEAEKKLNEEAEKIMELTFNLDLEDRFTKNAGKIKITDMPIVDLKKSEEIKEKIEIDFDRSETLEKIENTTESEYKEAKDIIDDEERDMRLAQERRVKEIEINILEAVNKDRLEISLDVILEMLERLSDSTDFGAPVNIDEQIDQINDVNTIIKGYLETNDINIEILEKEEEYDLFNSIDFQKYYMSINPDSDVTMEYAINEWAKELKEMVESNENYKNLKVRIKSVEDEIIEGEVVRQEDDFYIIQNDDYMVRVYKDDIMTITIIDIDNLIDVYTPKVVSNSLDSIDDPYLMIKNKIYNISLSDGSTITGKFLKIKGNVFIVENLKTGNTVGYDIDKFNSATLINDDDESIKDNNTESDTEDNNTINENENEFIETNENNIENEIYDNDNISLTNNNTQTNEDNTNNDEEDDDEEDNDEEDNTNNDGLTENELMSQILNLYN